jgi:hypothetical protein
MAVVLVTALLSGCGERSPASNPELEALLNKIAAIDQISYTVVTGLKDSDSSVSMQVWIKMLVQLVQAIGLELSKKELFIFAHDLEWVTSDLKKTWKDTIEALKQRENWGGTTNIDIALKNLQKNHHDKFGPQSIVLLLSDLFTAEPEKAADEVRKITRRTKRFFIFRAVDDEIAREEYNTYFETYVRPFIGTASAIYDINSIDFHGYA